MQTHSLHSIEFGAARWTQIDPTICETSDAATPHALVSNVWRRNWDELPAKALIPPADVGRSDGVVA